MHKSWHKMPHVERAIAKLSPECVDLLDRIFIVDEVNRITVEVRAWSVCLSACQHARPSVCQPVNARHSCLVCLSVCHASQCAPLVLGRSLALTVVPLSAP
jgi:hypothetical protein